MAVCDASWVGCVQLSEEDLKPYLDKVGDRALKHALEYGVAFLHETQPAAEQEVVNLLFNTGAIQVCPPSRRAPPKAHNLSLVPEHHSLT